MKNMMVTVTAVIVGLSIGCAQIEHLQNPANYRVNQLTGQRMYCHGDQRDNYTICEGFETPAQIAQKAEQAKIAEANARIAAKKQAIAAAKQAAIDKIAKDEVEKFQAIEDEKYDIAAAKAKAFAASPAGKREAEAQAKRAAEDFKAMFGGAIEEYNNMTPEERRARQEKAEERRYQEKLIRDQNNYIKDQNRIRQNLWEHRR